MFWVALAVSRGFNAHQEAAHRKAKLLDGCKVSSLPLVGQKKGEVCPDDVTRGKAALLQVWAGRFATPVIQAECISVPTR